MVKFRYTKIYGSFKIKEYKKFKITSQLPFNCKPWIKQPNYEEEIKRWVFKWKKQIISNVTANEISKGTQNLLVEQIESR